MKSRARCRMQRPRSGCADSRFAAGRNGNSSDAEIDGRSIAERLHGSDAEALRDPRGLRRSFIATGMAWGRARSDRTAEPARGSASRHVYPLPAGHSDANRRQRAHSNHCLHSKRDRACTWRCTGHLPHVSFGVRAVLRVQCWVCGAATEQFCVNAVAVTTRAAPIRLLRARTRAASRVSPASERRRCC